MPEFAVTAIGRDRPGIVAAVSGALLDLDGNVEDSQMSILCGHFAVMLLVRVPDGVERAQVADALSGVRDELGLEAVTVAPVGAGALPARATHVLSVYGADRRGIVHAVSSTLAGLGVNICDLETKLVGTPEAPVYVMTVEVALGDADPAAVSAALAQAGGEAGLEVTLRELDNDPL